MTKTLLPALLLALFGTVSLGQSEAPGLSEEGKTFLDTLRRASWSGRASANGTGVTVRSAPIFSAGMLNAVRNRASLDAGQRKDLDDVARVILPEAGWFIKALVPAGTYHLGLEFKGRNPQWVVFDSTGKRLFADAFWIHQTTGKNAGGQAMASGGTATVTDTGSCRRPAMTRGPRPSRRRPTGTSGSTPTSSPRRSFRSSRRSHPRR
jgi:hypothetical protein